jgi:hypothetical protein
MLEPFMEPLTEPTVDIAGDIAGDMTGAVAGLTPNPPASGRGGGGLRGGREHAPGEHRS